MMSSMNCSKRAVLLRCTCAGRPGGGAHPWGHSALGHGYLNACLVLRVLPSGVLPAPCPMRNTQYNTSMIILHRQVEFSAPQSKELFCTAITQMFRQLLISLCILIYLEICVVSNPSRGIKEYKH